MQQKFLISIQGPTASGKTGLAIEVAQWLNTAIISCDSRQFYRELKIGAAPPSSEELALVKHHFIHSHSVKHHYNAGDFEKDALAQIERIHTTNNFVVMVGGSGLYADAVLKGFNNLPAADEALRKKLELRLQEHGIEDLQNELQEKDPVYFNRVDQNNPHRLIRALEVIQSTRKTMTQIRERETASRPFKALSFAIDWPREQLYNRINKRVDLMLQQGLLKEVEQLLPYKAEQALNTVGYKELFAFLEGQTSFNEAIELIKRNSRRYAKRQLTWLRRNPQLHWVAPDSIKTIKQVVLNNSSHAI